MNKFKILLVILIINFNANQLFCQDILVTGAEWHYSTFVWGNGSTFFNSFKIIGDSIISGTPCKVIERDVLTCDWRGKYEYVYKDDGKLFYFEETIEEFRMLYDFNAEVGDTVHVNYWPNFLLQNPDSIDWSFYMIVDSISILDYGTTNLKQFHVTYSENQSYGQKIIVEDIGSLINLFHFFEDGFCHGSYNTDLRCFNHPDYGLIQFGNVECEYVNIVNGLNVSPELVEIEIWPVPFSDKINIKIEENAGVNRIAIYNVLGEIVFQQDVKLNNFVVWLSETMNKNGELLIVNFYDNNEILVGTQKIVRH